MKNLLLIFLIAATFLNCKNEGNNTDGGANAGAPSAANQSTESQRTEIGNFEYWHHIKNDGPKPMPAQAVFYHYQMWKGGKVVQTNFGGDPSGGIITSEEEAKASPQALMEGLRHMAVGDSMTIIFPVQGQHTDSSYIYNIVLRSIHSL